MVYVYYIGVHPYCGASNRGGHGKMRISSDRSQRDGGLRVYYYCRCDGCSNSSLEYSKPRGMNQEEFDKLVEEAEAKAEIKKEERRKRKEQKEKEPKVIKVKRVKPIMGNLQTALREARLA
jgi:hypothetical protein